jgi:PAS domain S-box-containing protein
MVGAIVMVHAHFGFYMNWFGQQKGGGFEYHLLAIGLAVAVLVRGAGSFSIDGLLSRSIAGGKKEMSISQNDTLHDAQAQMIEACSESVARDPKGSRSSRLFAGLPYNGLTSESVEDEAGVRIIANEAERRWNSVEDALRLVIDTTPALIHTGRPDGYLDYFNQRWLEFLGLPLEEVCGWRWTGAVHSEDVAGLLQKWHAALGSGEPFEAEARVRRADGEYRLLLHRKVPLRNERGDILRWCGSSVDIEEQRRAQERILQDERERLREALLAEAQRITRIGTFVQRLTRVGSFLFRLPDATEYWSPESFQIFGADPAKGPPRNMSEYQGLGARQRSGKLG